ncbi:MAG: SoxR reducing system RseC family protein [Paludibacteraceae bacterium]|nr:SoxR reducing system RseC family protein [Paludibacteraceae bacterium]
MSEQISHEAIVEQVADHRVHVRIVQTAACAGCKAKSMCTASESAVKELDAIALEPVAVGDQVLVEVSRKLGWKAVLLAFVLPFCLMLLVVLLLPRWVGNEAVVGTVAIVSLAPYYLVLHLFDDRLQREYRFVVRKA